MCFGKGIFFMEESVWERHGYINEYKNGRKKVGICEMLGDSSACGRHCGDFVGWRNEDVYGIGKTSLVAAGVAVSCRLDNFVCAYGNILLFNLYGGCK